MSDLVRPEDVDAAARRLHGNVRATPLIAAAPVFRRLAPTGAPARFDLHLKLECLQIGGSFKVRGALNKLALLDPLERAAGLVTASGGNHGVAVAYAAASQGLRATVHFPETVSPVKLAAVQRLGAATVIDGATWDDANALALAAARTHGYGYIHPFGDPAVIAGQGTIALEVLAALPHVDTLLVAVGGGGLIGGIATAAKAIKPGIRIVGIEPTGAASVYRSVREGRLVTLDRVETRAGTLAPRRSMPINIALVRELVDRLILVSDEEMRDAARWLWQELGLAVELAGAAALAALATGRYEPLPDETVVAIVCGTGTDGLDHG